MTGGQAHQNLPSFVNFDRPPATTLPPVEEPTLLFFDGLTAHEVRQDAVELTDEQRCGNAEVPHECTRTAEFPVYSSYHLHGRPHQSRAEVATAYATGVPPDRWAHVWTGNRQDATAASYLEPLVAPAPVGLNTLLARCLVQGTDADGRHAFATYPQAVGWLLEAAASGGGLTAIEEAELMQACAVRVRVRDRVRAGPRRARLSCPAHHSATPHVTPTFFFCIGRHASRAATRDDRWAEGASRRPGQAGR